VEAGGVFGFDYVEVEPGSALVFLGLGELLRVGVLFDVRDQFHEGAHGDVAGLEEAALDLFEAGLHFLFGEVVAALAGAVDVEERALDVVAADLQACA
jgi:hypothetical protein